MKPSASWVCPAAIDCTEHVYAGLPNPVSRYGYTGDRTAIRDAIIGRAERNAAMIRQFADGGEPVVQRMLPWAHGIGPDRDAR